MKRNTFLKMTALGSLALGMGGCGEPDKTHILTLSFDDGFKKSFYRIAEIHESYGLRACFNVIASGHLPSFKGAGNWIRPELLGNFDDWNALKSRGHEIMPHSWEHLKLTEIPLEQAQTNIDKCLDYFARYLEGYRDEDAVYNFAYNASTQELDAFALQRVAAVRTGGWLVLKDTQVNLIPTTPGPLQLGCWSRGPELCDAYVEETVNAFLASPGGWLIINLHGLDAEGWGPVSTVYLDGLLRRLVKVDFLAVLPAGEVIRNRP